jgi:hypothetical protein
MPLPLDEPLAAHVCGNDRLILEYLGAAGRMLIRVWRSNSGKRPLKAFEGVR